MFHFFCFHIGYIYSANLQLLASSAYPCPALVYLFPVSRLLKMIMFCDATIGTDSTESVLHSYFGTLLILLNLDLTVIATFFSTGM